jgi:DNA-binding NtrC family response regulator
MTKGRVLIIEDESSLSEILLRMLEFFDFEGLIANTGEDALKIIDMESIDFIILDLTLPDYTGIELYQKIVEKKSPLRQRIIFTSGHRANNELEDLMTENKLSFLPKPFTVDQLKSVIDKFIE